MRILFDKDMISLKNGKEVFGRLRSFSAVRGWKLLIASVVFIAFLSGTAFTASSQIIRLDGSDFEIDENANLTVDEFINPNTGRPSIDWAAVPFDRQDDTPAGSTDDSFKGSKEDDVPPTVDYGSIPPNKSDLKTFGIYVEENPDGKFLNLFWTRVQDPSGTTNMDFEFNRNKCDLDDLDGSVCSDNGVTPVRSPGDLLIVYELTKGGTIPELFAFRWYDATNGPTDNPALDCEASHSYPCWGGRTSLTDAAGANGSINSSFIPASESAGLGDLDPRTFGEASIDLSLVFDPTKCESFGSAYLKSRSSDSFTSAMKDFIAPLTTTISNCGTVIIRKQTDPDGAAGTFGYTTNLLTDPPSSPTFTLSDNGVQLYDGIVVAGFGYTVTEDNPVPDGFDLTSIVCTGDPVAINVAARSITFDMTVGGIVDCTFTNTQRGRILVDKVTDPADNPELFNFSLTGGPDGIDQPFQLADNSTPYDSGQLKPSNGTPYSLAETVPAGWDLTSATCDDGSSPDAINLAPGETVTCTFTNTAHGNIIIDKVTEPPGDPQMFGFLLTGGPDGINQSFQLADATPPYDSGEIKPGIYAAAETVPAGWDLISATCDDGSSPDAINLAPGETVTCTFTNSTGAIKIVKTAKNANDGPGDQPQAGVDFEIRLGGVLVDTVTTGSDGTACLDGLIPGEEYTVTEIVPDGYEVDSNNPQTVTVTAGATCSSGTPNVVNFSNTPLSKLDFIFHSLAGAGVTNATIQCVDIHGTPVDLQDGVTFSLDNLLPDTYTCTIVIDP
jgi:hypothetical protein